jgi:hypothetical protein
MMKRFEVKVTVYNKNGVQDKNIINFGSWGHEPGQQAV